MKTYNSSNVDVFLWKFYESWIYYTSIAPSLLL